MLLSWNTAKSSILMMHAPWRPSPPVVLFFFSFRNTCHHLPSCPRIPLPSRWNSRKAGTAARRLEQPHCISLPVAQFVMAPSLSLAMHKQFTTFCRLKGLLSLPLTIVLALGLRKCRASSSIRRRSLKRDRLQGLSLPHQLHVSGCPMRHWGVHPGYAWASCHVTCPPPCHLTPAAFPSISAYRPCWSHGIYYSGHADHSTAE